jgi:hypothetical protein
MVPVNAVALIIPHSGEKHTTGLGLLDDIFDNLRAPIVVLSVIQWISSNGQSSSGTKDYATVAANAILFAAPYFIVFSIIRMNIEGALVDAHLASDTPRIVSLHYEFWWQICLHLILFL